VAFKQITTIFIFGSLLLCAGCAKKPTISFFCEKDRKGNYIIKWEINPHNEEGKVGIYMSKDDTSFPEPPLLNVSVNDFVVNIPTNDSIGRSFFRLKVDKTNSGIISNRVFRMDSIQNFRDAGGYFTTEREQVKWGKLYRSGELSEISRKDKNVLDALQIKTIIDFRDHEEILLYPDVYQTKNMIHLPMVTGNRAYVREQILNGTFYRGDAILFTQDTYKVLIDDFGAEYARFFDILCDENNYPILFHGYLGKDRVGLATYFLLLALGVSNDSNEDDYLMSNSCISEQQVMGEARFLPERMQEAATVVCQTHILYLNYAKTCMRNKSGSIEDYMEKELKLTEEKRHKLRQILLYQ